MSLNQVTTELQKYNGNIEEKQVMDMEKIIEMMFNVDVSLKGTEKTARGIRAFSNEKTIVELQKKVNELAQNRKEKKKRKLSGRRIDPGIYYMRIPIRIWTKDFATKHVAIQYYTYEDRVKEMANVLLKKYKNTLRSGLNDPNFNYIKIFDNDVQMYVQTFFTQQFYIVFRIQVKEAIGMNMIKNNFAPLTIPIKSKRYSHGSNQAVIGKVITRTGIISPSLPVDFQKKNYEKFAIANNNS